MDTYRLLGVEMGGYRSFGSGMTVTSKLDFAQGRHTEKRELGEWAKKRIEERKAEAERKAAWRAKRAKKLKAERSEA